MNKHLRFFVRAALWACALLLATQWTAHAQVLEHRYSFFDQSTNSTTAIDLIGDNTGTFFGAAAVTNGGYLYLDGDGYVQLQSGIVTNDVSVSVEAWCVLPVFGGQTTWANLFDFGTQDANGQDSYSISFCLNTSGGQLDAAISDFDNANVNRYNCYADENLVYSTNSLQTNYIVAVYDPPASNISIWINGALASTTPIAATITPGVRDRDNWIGKDNWPDPNAVVAISEFRVWNGVLGGPQIAASYQYGFTNISTNAGSITSITVSANPQVVLGGVEPASVTATASLITNTVSVTTLATYSSANTNIASVDASGLIHGVSVGSTSISALYQGNSNSVTVSVIEPISVLANRYSFNDSGSVVVDSVGGRNGKLEGTATESGGQVVLDGTVGCYVDLSSNTVSQNGIISGYQSATVDYWATFGTLQNWNYAWAFGNTVNGAGQNYIHSVVRDGNTQHEIDNFTVAGGAGVTALGDFTGEAVHCTTVIDIPTGHLAIYTNGVLSGYTASDLAPLSSVGTNLAYIGRSLWTSLTTEIGDPYVPASFDEFRVYNGTLTPQQIALADVLGPNNTNITVGALQSIAVSIPTLNLGDIYRSGTWATYANLTNFDLLRNNLTSLPIYTSSNSNVVYQATDGSLHAVGTGTATVTANYKGLTASQAVTVVYAPKLVDRYSFQDAVGSTNAIDSIGGETGVLPNGGTYSGTNLLLQSTGPQYVQLPPGILKNYPAVTIDMWFTSPDEIPVNSMLWAFGNTDAGGAGYNYIFCAPQGGRIAISGVDPGYDGEQGCGGAGDLSLTTNMHVTAVFDPPAGTEFWYTNGVLVSSNLAITIPMSYVDAQTNFICHSLYTGDPHEDLYLGEFRIYNGALSASDVALSQTLGPSQLLPGTVAPSGPTLSAAVSTVASGQLVISWPTSAGASYGLYSSPTLGPTAVWTSVGGATTVGANYQVSVPTSASAQFYILKN